MIELLGGFSAVHVTVSCTLLKPLDNAVLLLCDMTVECYITRDNLSLHRCYIHMAVDYQEQKDVADFLMKINIYF